MNPIDFQAHAQKLVELEAQVANASEERRRELESDRSLWAKMHDYFADTPVEQGQEAAQKALKAHQDQVRNLLGQEVERLTREKADNDPATRDELNVLLPRIRHVEARQERFTSLYEKGKSALEALSNAASKCSGASTMELFDMASNNAGISLMSSIDTSRARQALETANDEINAFAEAYSSFQDEIKSRPDDTLDLALDLSIGSLDLPGFDIFSLFNMCALNEAEEECEQAHEKLNPMVERLGKVVDTIAGRHADLKAQEAALLYPHRKEVVVSLPSAIVALEPALLEGVPPKAKSPSP